jgi:hypothetical protein
MQTSVPLLQLDLMGDDGLIVPQQFPACIFANGFKGKYKLQCEEKHLRALLNSDSEVVFVGRFKENKYARPGDRRHSLNVTSFAPWQGGSGDASNEANAEAVYPQRCALLL